MARTKELTALSRAFAIAYFASFMFAPDASAGSLTNLDSRAYTFTIEVAGEAQKVTLEPGQTHSSDVGQDMIVFADNGKQRIRMDEEYAIWKGGKMLLQGRTKKGQPK